MKKPILILGFVAMIFATSCQNTTTQTNDTQGIFLEKAKLIGDEQINSPYGLLEKCNSTSWDGILENTQPYLK